MSGNLNYRISNPIISLDNGVVIAPPGHCWSGNDSNPDVNPLTLPDGTPNPDNVQGKNNPMFMDVHCKGPIPACQWKFNEWAFTLDDIKRLGYPTHLGLGICHLTPIPDTGDSFGRTGIYMHGPTDPNKNPSHYGQESEGCVVVEHDFRINQVAARKPDTLTVTTA
jgi:hypothetical protein